jgi:hypothetical protein
VVPCQLCLQLSQPLLHLRNLTALGLQGSMRNLESAVKPQSTSAGTKVSTLRGGRTGMHVVNLHNIHGIACVRQGTLLHQPSTL